MDLFLELEGPYMVIGLFILSITAFVTTRDFVPRVAFKRGMISVTMGLFTLISIHYYMTTTRMTNVEAMYNAGETVICENKMQRTISQSVLIRHDMGWSVENHLFKNPDYVRDFHSSRCVEWIGSDPQVKQAEAEAKKSNVNAESNADIAPVAPETTVE
jgi:hypothetical protein